jgi:hypothetical protein
LRDPAYLEKIVEKARHLLRLPIEDVDQVSRFEASGAIGFEQ